MGHYPEAGRRGGPAFTLIELMLVVATIALLGSIASPKFAELLRKAREGGTKGNLGRLRSAINLYAADNEGWYPSGGWSTNSTVLSSTLVPKYLNKIPNYHAPDYHAPSSVVFNHQANTTSHTHDGGGWGYDGMGTVLPYARDEQWGSVWVFCTHSDTKGRQWTTY